MRAKCKRAAIGIAVAVFWLGVWSLVCFVANKNLLMPLPYPWDVAVSLWSLLGRGVFWMDVGMSLLRILAGFLMAVISGALLALLTARFRLLHVLLLPVLSVVRSVPVASFIFLAFLWISSDAMPTFIAFLMVVPIVYSNLYEGFNNVD